MAKGMPRALARASNVAATGLVERADHQGHLDTYEEVDTGSVAVAANLKVYQTLITTGDTDGNESLTLGNGTGVVIGTRKLIKLQTRTGTDTVVLDHANIVNAAGAALSAATMDAAGETLVVEWNGTKWQAIWVIGTTLTTA